MVASIKYYGIQTSRSPSSTRLLTWERIFEDSALILIPAHIKQSKIPVAAQ